MLIVISFLPIVQSDFILPEFGGGMVHCDPQLTDNIRLPVPTTNIGKVWYRRDLGGEKWGTQGIGTAGNNRIAACGFNNLLGVDNLITYDYYGNHIWSSGQGLNYSLNAIACSSTPMVDVQNRVVACDNEKIILVNVSNQKVDWISNFSSGGGRPFSPTIVENKTIILPTEDGLLYAFNLSNGQLLANLTFSDNSNNEPFYGIRKMNWSDFNKVMCKPLNCPYHYNSISKTIEWNSTVSYGIMPMTPIFYEGNIMFLTDQDGVATAVDKTTGSILAINSLGTPELVTGEKIYSTINSACVKDNRVFVVTQCMVSGYRKSSNYSGRLYAVDVYPDAKNSSDILQIKWNYSYTGQSQASPLLINDTLYFDGFNGPFSCIIPPDNREPHIYAVYTNGTERWNISHDTITAFSFTKDPRGGFWYLEDGLPVHGWGGENLVRFSEEDGSPLDEIDVSDYFNYLPPEEYPCSAMTICGNTTNPIMLVSVNHFAILPGKWIVAIDLSNNSLLWKVRINSLLEMNSNIGQYTILNETDVDISRILFGTWFFGGVMALGPYPDCWFESDPSYTFLDSDEDNYPDCVNVSFTLKTSLLQEHATVNLVLHPKSDEHPFLSLLYRQRESKEFNVTQGGVNGYINVTIPDNFPICNYVVQLYLCNTTGNVCLDAIDSINIMVSGAELIYYIQEMTDLGIIEKLFPHLDEIRDNIQLDILDLIYRLQDIRPVRNLLIDLIGHYCVSDDRSNSTSFMAPPNDPPAKPDTPVYIGKSFLGHIYQTKTTDPDTEDKIRFQWEWNGKKGFPSLFWYNSGQYHKKAHMWLDKGEKTIRVRAKNYMNPNYYSDWSEYLNVSIDEGCNYNILTSQTAQNNINNLYIQNSFKPANILVSQTVNYQGNSYGFSATPSYQYNFNDLCMNYSKNTKYTFGETGFKFVNLTANYNGTVAYSNQTVNIVNISPCFDMDQYGAQPNHTIYFYDTTISNRSIVNWTWDLGDGNISYDQNVTHNYSQVGVYNVTLNVTDSNSEVASFWQIVFVEMNPPDIIAAPYSPFSGGTLGCNLTIYAEFFDNNESGIYSANVNVSYPNGTTKNFSMYENLNGSYGYEFVFNDTLMVGWYYYTIWVTDNAMNSNSFAGCGFQILPGFGYSEIGGFNCSVMDRISGSNFTVLVNGTAESISAYIDTDLISSPKTKCMIYRVNDSNLIGTTEEKIVNSGDLPGWVTYNFSDPKPDLTSDTCYVLGFWSNDTCSLFYDNVSSFSFGRYNESTYGSPPQEVYWEDESRLYSIYCLYSTVPEVISAVASPGSIGFGFSTTIDVGVEHYFSLVDNISINVTYPDCSFLNCSMDMVDDDNFQFVFDDAWDVGQYNFTVWVRDKLGGCVTSSGHSFNVSAQADIFICTIKDDYGSNESVNLTDPPLGSSDLGYELLDGGDVLHIWNRFDSYYFNTSSGIQLTNHFDEYWSHNVLMLGYYNNDEWNLIYRTDELSDFNKNITSDYETYVNATLLKDLTFGGYDFRLAIRYHLGIDDGELTVIPYIKNQGDQMIPYDLGFAWEINNIQVDMTPEKDYLQINQTDYDLNESLDLTFTNISQPIYCFNDTTNETYVCGYDPLPYLYIKEDLANNVSESLYLRWDESLNYKVKVKSRTGQYNAPVTLGLKIGTLAVGQEKFTSLFWHDAEEMVYYFDTGYDSPSTTWESSPEYMVDGNENTYSYTASDGDVELLTGNSYEKNIGTISKVELRCKGCQSNSYANIILRPIFGGTYDGDDHVFYPSTEEDWSNWYDITSDTNAPVSWGWEDIEGLDCDVESDFVLPFRTVYCSKVEIRITYTPEPTLPCISNLYPGDGTIGIGIQPLLNITVSHAEGKTMNISWYSNSSGSCEQFGTNLSVGNGTYYQTFCNASVNGVWWYWNVSVDDGDNTNVSDVYKFYTGYESKIKNTGSMDISGYLCMQVHFFNGNEWELADDTVNETSPRAIKAGEQLGLDTIFNGLVNTNDLYEFGSGTYLIYAAFCNPYGDVLVCDNESLMEATYEFTVS